jgi:hypothetical protein
MNKSLLLGFWKILLRVPHPIWQAEVARGARAAERSLAFMTANHHRVRDYAVRELPRFGKAIPPQAIARDLGLDLDVTISILDDLEKKLTFLYRDESGAVLWAYPVTAAATPQRMAFSTGEHIYAA